MELNFAVIDVVLSLLILAAAVRGAIRGFITEAGSMAAVILGVLAAVLFSGSLARLIQGYFGESLWNQVIAFLILFLATYIAVKLVEVLLHSIFSRLNLERLDRALGFFLGIGEGLLLVVLILFVLDRQPFFEATPLLTDSLFVKFLFPLLPSAREILKGQPFLKDA